ncbi:MAG: tetratricopeptide repeat protein [Lentisphaeria bacterium]|nr:tetratricopeptide repeat protein [Lentisphaeria bacterium]MDY0176093.1 tetratricopeptide repeat protein [Lentisphaeria bacterium]NLZ60362.1 tetratricopeptide repeat protein [Lentisphaerota bacterium]
MRNNTLKQGIKIAALAIFSVILLLSTVSAIDEFELDLEFLRELSRIEFNDYAELQLTRMQKKYPERKDVINLEKARVFYSLGRGREADLALAAIAKDSPLKDEVMLLQAQVFAARRNWVEADKVFKKYFAANPKPASNRRADANSFKQAVMVYNLVLKSMNKPAEAAKILDLLANVKGAVDERQMQFLKLQTAIDAEENRLLGSGKIDAKALQAAIVDLENLQFIRDGVAASASVQMARAYILQGRAKMLPWLKNEKGNAKNIAKIGDFAQAVRGIDMIYPRLEELEKSLGLENSLKSPVVEAMFYKAIAFASQAQVSFSKGEIDKSRAQIRGAAAYLERILQEYPDSSFQNKILTEHEACNQFSSAKFDEALELRQGGGAALVSSHLEKADAFLQKKDYKSAFPFCLAALRAGRTSGKLPDIGLRLIMCQAEMDDLNAADALLDYLGLMAPQAAGTADAALRLGVMLSNKSREEKSPARQAELERRAMQALDKFVNAAPSHPRAPDIAFSIAENQYKVASELALASNQESNEKAKRELQEKTLAAFREALPKYQRMIDVFSVFDKGVRSLYKLAWCHDALDEKGKAVELFLSYYESERQPAYANDRLQAKFRAAYLLLYGDNPAEATAHFEELLAVLSDKESPFDLKGKTALQIQEDSASLLAWSFHLTAEKLRPQMNVFQRRQELLARRISAFQKSLAESEEERRQAAREGAALQQAWEEQQKVFADYGFDFEAMAAKQLAEHSEDTSKMSEEEKQVHQRTQASDLKERSLKLEQQKKHEMAGTIEMQEKRRAEAISGKTEAEKILARHEEEKLVMAQELKESQAKIDAAKKEAAEMREALRESSKLLSLADADRQTAQNLKSELEAKVDESQGTAKEQLQQELEQVNADFEKINQKFQQAFLQNQAASSDESRQKIEELERLQVSLTEELEEKQAEMRRLENDLARARVGLQAQEAEQLAAARYLALARLYQEALAQSAELRVNSLPDIARERENASQASAALKQLQMKRFELRLEYLDERDKHCQKGVEETEKLLAEQEKDLSPLHTQFLAWKNEAVKQLLIFLDKYPNSEKTPDNMSLLGSIYLFDINEAQKASEILRRLASDFPKAPATQKALFMLGRAQAENNNLQEASQTFAKLLDKPEELALGNLFYVSEVCLQANEPAAAALANREILRRAADPGHADAPLLSVGVRERASFALGQSLVAMKRYPEAVATLEKILRDNERSAYFFDAKFLLAEAKGNSNPPDWEGLEKDLYDILMLSSSPLLRNRASCYYAEALLRSGEAQRRSAALSSFQLVLLADSRKPENLDLIERALYGSAKIYAAEGKAEGAQEMLQRYQELFSGGKHLAEMQRMAAQ